MSNTPNLKIPVLALRGLVIFPNMMIQFDIGRKKSVLALAGAMEGEHLIFLDAQTDLQEGEPSKEQLCRMGVVARIKQVIRHSEEGVRLFAEGLYRASLEKVTQEVPYLEAEVTKAETLPYRSTVTTEALIRQTRMVFEDYAQNYAKIAPDILYSVMQMKDCGKLADYITANISLEYDRKQEELDHKFRDRMENFQKEYISWEEEYHRWQKEREGEISKIQKEISVLESQRDGLYDKLNGIPVHYRKTEIIRYIYNAVSTSDYTIKEAIELYDRNEQRKVDEARLREQLIYNQLQEEANVYADEMNELQREANETAEKARRDMNIANVAHIYQNHKRNKMLDRRNKK